MFKDSQNSLCNEEELLFYKRDEEQKGSWTLIFFYLGSLDLTLAIIVDQFIDIFIGLPFQCPYKACSNSYNSSRNRLFKHIRVQHDQDLPILNGGKSYIFKTTSGRIIEFNGKKNQFEILDIC